ncbi:MAG: DUF4838 domain-containing protein [Planctomycetota bacterium]|jgi:hypothetical protein
MQTSVKSAIAARAILFAVLSTAAVAAVAEQQPLTLVADGTSPYVIVLSADASPSERWAAEELASHVRQMSGATLELVDEGESTPEKAILIGDGQALRSLGTRLDIDPLGPEGFVIRTVGQRLVIAGGRPRGTMYGVFTLLEKLGCRWWYPGASTVPSVKTIRIAALDERQSPVLEYRDMLYGEMDDSEEAMIWRARNKVNGGFFKDMKPEYGGAFKFHTLVHSYGGLLPTSRYFHEHPEYYALRSGKRDASQPCFSNRDVIRLVADAILRLVAEHPDWRFFTVGQNDNSNYCQCDDCGALAERYRSHGGSQLHFAKEVAALVRQKRADVVINVPAYRWTRKPPAGITPDDKMAVTLCSIECNFGQPLEDGYPEENAAFKADIEGWSKLAPKLYIWDYTTNFTHYVLPYPNYHVLAPNVRFYADHKVRGIMHQGSHTTRHGQFAPLCTWVLAKAMWDPSVDGRKLVEEFCLGYYGPQAGRLVLEYANMLHEAIARDRTPIWCTRRTYLSAPYLSPELMARAEQIFRQAEAAVADDSELLRRVRIDHFPVQYVVLKRAGQLWEPVRRVCPDLSWTGYTQQFAWVGRQARISRVREGDHAEELFEWALDYGRIKQLDPKADLPDELSREEPSTYHFLQAAQLDGQVRFLKKATGATDGWAQQVISTGWSIQHRFSHPWDFDVGKSYRMFIRVKATAAGAAEGDALTVGIHNPDQPRTCSRRIGLGEVNGQWQVFDVGPWKPTENGGVFYIARGRAAVSEVYLDCLWLIEAPE